MAAVVVDPNVLIAAQLSRDRHHETAAEIADGMEAGGLPTGLVPEDVLAEVLNFLQKRSGHAAAVEMLDGVVRSDGLEVTPHADHDAVEGVVRLDAAVDPYR